MSHENLPPELKDISGRDTVNVIYVNSRGQFRRAPDSCILNIAGVIGPDFTVGGKAVLLHDGTTSDGITNATIDLQFAYDNSLTNAGDSGYPTLKLDSQHGLTITSDDGTSSFVVFHPDGKVEFLGEVSIQSAVAKFAAAYQEADHFMVHPSDGSRPAIYIEPKSNVSFTSDLIRVHHEFGSPLDLSIDRLGNTYIRSLLVDEIDSPEISQLQSDVNVLNDSIANLTTAVDSVETEIANINNSLQNIDVSGLVGFHFSASTASTVWTINHNMNSFAIQFSIFDESNNAILPENAYAQDANSFKIEFNQQQAGSATLIIMKQPIAV